MAETAALSTGSAAPPSRQRRNWVPYALLLPGLLWLVVFFVLPMLTLGSQSLQEGNVDDGYTFTGNVGIYAEALRAYWPQTSSIAALLAPYGLTGSIAASSVSGS